MRANDAMREDPIRRKAVRRQIAQRQAAFREAQRLLDQAAALLAALEPIEDDNILKRNCEAVRRAQQQMTSDSRYVLAEPTDTLIGNLAAFGSPIGWRPTLEEVCTPD